MEKADASASAFVVEVTGLEPAASSSRTKHSTKLSYTSKYTAPIVRGLLAAELGFEPRQTESESVVLPLHNSASLNSNIYYIRFFKKVKPFCRIFLFVFILLVLTAVLMVNRHSRFGIIH